jgi:hypothetical protein
MLVQGDLDCVPARSVADKYVALRAVANWPLAQSPVLLLHPTSAESRIISDSPAGAISALMVELPFDCPGFVWGTYPLAPADVWSAVRDLFDFYLLLKGRNESFCNAPGNDSTSKRCMVNVVKKILLFSVNMS